jgi:hypothetical protein
VSTQEPAGRIVGVQVAEDEPAPVEEDDERVRPSALFGGVVPRGERAAGAVDEQISHSSHGNRRAVRHGDLATEGLAGFGWREGL